MPAVPVLRARGVLYVIDRFNIIHGDRLTTDNINVICSLTTATTTTPRRNIGTTPRPGVLPRGARVVARMAAAAIARSRAPRPSPDRTRWSSTDTDVTLLRGMVFKNIFS